MSETVRQVFKSTPSGWNRSPLSWLGRLTNGINKNAADFGYGVPFVNLLDVFGVFSVTGYPEGLVNATEDEIRRYDLHVGDVLFVRSSVKPEGVGLTAVVLQTLERTIYSGFLIRFRPEPGLFAPDFLKYCFHEDGFRGRLRARSTVSANTNINQESLRQLRINIPPLSQQRKIAKILTTVDNLIEKTEALIAKYQSIKQGDDARPVHQRRGRTRPPAAHLR
jgi:type I restriction enzyme S subunit